MILFYQNQFPRFTLPFPAQAVEINAGTDPVAIDTYAATLLGREPHNIRHIQYAHELGIGEIDLKKLSIKEISVS